MALSDADRWSRRWPPLAMVIAGLALFAFYLYSQTHQVTFGYFTHLPVYGKWIPRMDSLALWVLPAGLALAAVGWSVTASRRVPTWLALLAVVAAGVFTAAMVELVRGDAAILTRGIGTEPRPPYYTADLRFVEQYGIRGFSERHPDLAEFFNSWNSRTHPPGVLVLLFMLFRLFGSGHPLVITTAIAVLGLAAAGSAWAMAREFDNERSGRVAAVLLAAAPGPLLLAYTAMDAVFATVLTAAAAMFVIAIHRTSWVWAAAGGAALGAGAYLTYAVSFVALAATIAVAFQVRGLRTAVRLLGAAAVAGVLVLAAERLVLGFDLLASFGVVPDDRRPYDPYWIVGSPAVFLIFAGIPLAGLGVLGLFARLPDGRRPVLPLVLTSMMVIWAMLPSEITHLRPGEVERTWAFLYPMLAACAAPVVARWTRGGRWSGAVVAGLVVLSVAQAVLLQSLWDTIF